MKTHQFKYIDRIASFETYYLDFYLKSKSRDCILYSADGSKIKVHKCLVKLTMTQKGYFEINCPLCQKVKKKYTKEFKCNDCGASFIGEGGLKRHINAIHLKNKPYECNQCKKSFTLKGNLDTHIKEFCKGVHEKVKAHKWQDCNTIFSAKCYLSRHVKQVHLKIKPSKKIICEKCDAPFEQKQHLEHHMNKVHLNVKPYECM